MKITIDVPDIMPANFERPSTELLCFIKDFQALCVRLTEQYTDAQGRNLFSAFVRNGAATVFCTDTGETKQMYHYDEVSSDREVEELYDAMTSDDGIVMDRDIPGRWVVARLCVPHRAGTSITLYSCDFESERGRTSRAEERVTRVVQHLAKAAHTVPSVSGSCL